MKHLLSAVDAVAAAVVEGEPAAVDGPGVALDQVRAPHRPRGQGPVPGVAVAESERAPEAVLARVASAVERDPVEPEVLVGRDADPSLVVPEGQGQAVG
jgi:hypothetical protein